jgi:hypothetical protein
MAKSSIFLPPLIAAASHLGLRPRPAQVSDGFSEFRYLGATEPLGPPGPAGLPRRLRGPPSSFGNSVSSSSRRVFTFSLIAASTLLFRSCSWGTDIVLRVAIDLLRAKMLTSESFKIEAQRGAGQRHRQASGPEPRSLASSLHKEPF